MPIRGGAPRHHKNRSSDNRLQIGRVIARATFSPPSRKKRKEKKKNKTNKKESGWRCYTNRPELMQRVNFYI